MQSTMYPRQSLREDAAMRASRDGDLSTLRFLIDQANLFDNSVSLREACQSGEWGDPHHQHGLNESISKQSYSTKDSILLHNLLLSAVTRAHGNVIEFLLDRFPARNLHVVEWELVVAALGTGNVKIFKPFVDVDPPLVKMMEQKVGNCFQIVLSLNDDSEDLKPMFEYLLENNANPNVEGGGNHVLEKATEMLPSNVIQMLKSKCSGNDVSP